MKDELILLFCSKTGLSQSVYHEMIYTWDRINETLQKVNEFLSKNQTSKQSRHKVLALRELETISNMMQTFENKYKIKCTDSVPDAIRDYQPPPPPQV